MDVESLTAAANRAQQADDAGAGNCSRIWHIGFFFDGIHRNIEQDAQEQRLTNVARLFRAYPTPEKNTANHTNDAVYISGLGTPIYEDLSTKLHTILDGAQSSAMDDLKDQPGDMAKDAAREAFKSGKWWEALKDAGKKLVKPAEWKTLAWDITKSAVKKVSIEATPWLRDNPTVADILVSGVDTRINSAKQRFEDFYDKAKSKSPVPIKLISVSLFGYDLGATLARKFLDDLLNEICKNRVINTFIRAFPLRSFSPAYSIVPDIPPSVTITAWTGLSLLPVARLKGSVLCWGINLSIWIPRYRGQ